jgi:hypothetical protein
MTVHSKIVPVLRVAYRKYRLRFLNVGPTQFYDLYLVNAGGTTSYTLTHIANDSNLLPAPLVNQFKVHLGGHPHSRSRSMTTSSTGNRHPPGETDGFRPHHAGNPHPQAPPQPRVRHHRGSPRST